MKKSVKTAFNIILPSVITVLSVIVLISAFSAYEDSGNILLVKAADYAAVTEKLDGVNLPHGAETVRYEGEDCLRIESRAELMPIITELCSSAEAEVIPVYRDAHMTVFYSIIISAAAVCLYCVIGGVLSKKRAVCAVLLTLAFFAAVGCMAWLGALPLAII